MYYKGTLEGEPFLRTVGLPCGGEPPMSLSKVKKLQSYGFDAFPSDDARRTRLSFPECDEMLIWSVDLPIPGRVESCDTWADRDNGSFLFVLFMLLGV